MTRGRASRTGVWLAVLAFAGLVAGHWLSYLMVAPSAHAREELLRATGHGSHDLFMTLGVAAGVAAVIAVVFGHVRSPHTLVGRGRGTVRSMLCLWAMQTTGFVALEAFERVHGLHELATLLQEPAFLVGLAAQAVVAVVAALVVWLLRATVDAILRLLTLPASHEEPQAGPLQHRLPVHSSIARAAWNLRGPPIAA